MIQQPVLPPLRGMPYGGAWSIRDEESVDFVSSIQHIHGDRSDFIHSYRDWFSGNKKYTGLENFKQLDFSAGTTETFHMFYFRHLDKRLRLLPGEYFYHHMMARNHFTQFKMLGDGEIEPGDVVVMSCPFSNTGNIPVDFYDTLAQCEKHKVPVMLDLAYISISDIHALDLNYECITTITTSLSKVFPVENHRVGIRMERELYDDAMVAYNQNDYVNLTSVNIGMQLIKRFDNEWLYNKYKDLQRDTCEELGIDTSSCVIFGLDTREKFPEYKRGTGVNRLCFSRVWDGRIDVAQD